MKNAKVAVSLLSVLTLDGCGQVSPSRTGEGAQGQEQQASDLSTI